MTDTEPYIPLCQRYPELFPEGWVDKGPATEVSTTEAITVRISTNQYGVKTLWLTGEDGSPHGCTACPVEFEESFAKLNRFLNSFMRRRTEDAPKVEP